MMYRHNVSVYDRAGGKLATISRRRRPVGAGRRRRSDASRVRPWKRPSARMAAMSSCRTTRCTAPGYDPVADDDCNRGDWDQSFVYRIDTCDRLPIDRRDQRRRGPEVLAVTPDGRLLASPTGVRSTCRSSTRHPCPSRGKVNVGRHPRGIAITADSRRPTSPSWARRASSPRPGLRLDPRTRCPTPDPLPPPSRAVTRRPLPLRLEQPRRHSSARSTSSPASSPPDDRRVSAPQMSSPTTATACTP